MDNPLKFGQVWQAWLAVFLWAVEIGIACWLARWTGPLITFPTLAGIFLTSRRPRVGLLLSMVGLGVMAMSPAHGASTSTFVLIALVATAAASGSWKRLALLWPAAFATGMWLSRGAGEAGQYGLAAGLWTLLLGAGALAGVGVWAATRANSKAAEERWNQQRREIAAELHDNVAHQLSVITLRAQMARRGEADPLSELEVVEASSRRATAALRSLVAVLKLDEGFQNLDLAEVLRQGVEELRGAGLDVRTDLSGELGNLPLAVSDTLARVSRECLNNMVKHASRKGVCSVIIDATGSAVEAAFINHTTGPRGTGFGLDGIRDRAKAAGGRCHISDADHLWSVRISLPYDGVDEPLSNT